MAERERGSMDYSGQRKESLDKDKLEAMLNNEESASSETKDPESAQQSPGESSEDEENSE